ncbi:MAG: glycosyltransferase family 39 protein [Cyanobacteria bacterium]|nr:glycosyltransferase family 39 protein [Cyanobacteriota bacterium]
MTILSVENQERVEASHSRDTAESLAAKESVSRRRSDRGRRADLTTLVCFTSVFLVACGVFFLHLGDHPLFNPDEALYSEPAREMLESGDYVTTYMNYIVRYTKPPLTIWAQAAAFQLLGTTEFAARLCSAASGAILVGITYMFAEKYLGRRSAIFAALSLATAPLFMGASRLSITDIPLSLLTAGALMSFYHGFQSKENRWKWIGYILLGLGVMTKGPVALVLPAGVLGIYHAANREIRRAWSYYNPIAGLIVVGLIAIPWFALEIYVTKGEYYYAFLVRENFERFTSVVDHKYGWWYHPLAMLGGFFPWTVFLVVATASYAREAVRKIRLLKAGAQNQNSWLNSFKLVISRCEDAIDSIDVKTKTVLFSVISVLFILVFFSISVSKLLAYTLPAFPFLALILGVQLDGLARKSETDAVSLDTAESTNRALVGTGATTSYAGTASSGRSGTVATAERKSSEHPAASYQTLESTYKSSAQKRGWQPVTIAFAILTVAALGGLVVPTALQHKLRDCPPELLTLIPAAVTSLAIACGAGLLVSLRSATKGLAAFFVGFLIILGTFGPRILDVIAASWETPMIEFVQFAAGSDRPIIVHAMRKPSATFYARRQVILTNREELEVRLSQLKDAYIVTRKHEADFVKNIPGCRVVQEKGTFSLLSFHSPSTD